MKLVRIARVHWDVLAVVDHRGHCQVLEFLKSLAPNPTSTVSLKEGRWERPKARGESP